MYPYEDLGKILSRQLKAMSAIPDLSKSLQLLRQPLLPNGLIEAVKAISSQNMSSIFKLSQDMNRITGITSGLYQTFARMNWPAVQTAIALRDFYSPSFKAIEAIQKSIASTAFPLISMNEVRSLSGAANIYKDLASAADLAANSHSFIHEELATISEVEDFSDDAEVEEGFRKIETSIVEQIRKTPAIRISFEGWVSLLLTLFIFLYGKISSDEFQARIEAKADSLERLDNRIIESQKKIYDALVQHMISSEAGGTAYVVTREVTLRARPSSRAQAVARLFPNQILKLDSRKGKWIRVTFFDYVAASVRTGWVLKKYTKRIAK